MAVIETWLRQDLKGLVTVRSLQGQVFSLDNGGNLIGVKVTKDGQPVTLTGTVTGYCILSDGQTVTVTGSGKSGIQNGNEAYIVLPQLVYSVPGQISIVIKLTSGSVTTTLAACTGYVYRSRTSNEVVPPGTPIPDLATLEEAISRANSATDSANTAASSANNAATSAENVNVAMSKSGKVITITATNRSGTSTSHTVTEPTLTVQRANNVVTVTATDADGQTSIEFDAVDADEVAELQEAVSTKAEEDGYYEELTAGSAEQLVSTEAVTDTTPYLYRKSGGSVDIGNRETLEKIVGGTVAWNQLIASNAIGGTYSGINVTKNEDGTYVFDGVATAELRFYFKTENHALPGPGAITGTGGHKLFSTGCPTGGSLSTYFLSYANGSGGLMDYDANADIGGGKISECHTSGIRSFAFVIRNGATVSNFTIKPQAFDLTAMFGPTIADYIYSLEQANAGAGVAWFRKLFPKDYYPYNPGELISVKATSHDMVGFNLYPDIDFTNGSINTANGSIESHSGRVTTNTFMAIDPSMQYYCHASVETYLFFYDKDHNYIGFNGNSQANKTFIPQNLVNNVAGSTRKFSEAKYMRARYDVRTYNGDFCINISSSRNGEYEPYEKHSYPLADVELRGPLAIDADGKLVYSGDEYTPDGNVKRKYGIVDLGTLDYVYSEPENRFYTSGLTTTIKKIEGNINLISNLFVAVTALAQITSGNPNLMWESATGNVSFSSNGYTTIAAFKTAMSGVMLVYELATPAIEQVAPYTPVQVIDDWGTEEFVDTREVAIPVGHSTSYMANLRDKLQHLPSLAEEDGEYIVKQTGSQMSLAPFKAGTYPDMHVGVADQLLSKQSVEDQVPYGFRQSGGGLAIGDREEDMIVGGTVGWNQLLQGSAIATQTQNGLTWSFDSNKQELTIDGTSTARTMIMDFFFVENPIIKDHVYYGINNIGLTLHCSRGGWSVNFEDTTQASIKKANSNADGGARMEVMSEGISFSNAKFKFQIFDLTAMFGPTIADYVYNLDQTTPRAGVAWFKKLFPKDYYEYNTGELKSVEAVNAHEMIGFNQWDEEWEIGTIRDSDGANLIYSQAIRSKNFIPVVPNASYYFKTPNGFDGSGANSKIYFYREDKTYISVMGSRSNVVTQVPDNAHYIRFALNSIATYDNDICINLSLSGARNGEYEPYHKSSYLLDSSLTLRGIPKLDANNKLYYDGDTYAGDGTVTRRYGIVDLGTLEWIYNISNLGAFTSVGISTTVASRNVFCGLYPTKEGGTTTGEIARGDKWLSINKGTGQTGSLPDSSIIIKDSAYTDATAFKAAMSGVMLVYELATPTTEQAEPYQSVQQVDPYGTEEYTHSGDADVYVPVGHVTKYPSDLRSKIENAPNSPSGNGDYIVRKTADGVSYVPLTQAKEIPAPPSANGTYRLTVTVSNGTPTYSWVSA